MKVITRKNYQFIKFILNYFKNSKSASDWFKMADPFYQNWRSVYDVYFKDKKPWSFNKNVMNNLITHSMDETENVSIVLNNFYDIDVWSSNLWNEDVSEEWTGLLNNWYKDNGEIISTKEIKTTLLELINNENKSKPFTDDELADLLGKEDYHIARRTTAKYRESLKIPVSRLRKKL